MKVIQPRTYNPRKTLFAGTVILILIIVYVVRDPAGPESIHWRGRTMGTHYDIQIAQSPLSLVESRRLHQEVERYLRDVNEEMSTYIPDSEINRFNRNDSTEPIAVSPSFASVTREALRWAERTGGAFDPTLEPLIRLWGFGHRPDPAAQPSQEAIDEILRQIGPRHVAVPDEFHIRKTHPRIQLNLNAIAKGDAVDGLVRRLQQAGISNLYVEIGGDLVISGVNREEQPWRIGVEEPNPDAAPGEQLHGIAHLRYGALAGSGDYRQFREDAEGHTLTHILDPRTGKPVRHALSGVNVWSKTCVVADAIATALMVMGTEEGMAWIETTPEAEAIFFERTADGDVQAFYSSGFRTTTGYKESRDRE